jgi:acyl-coenzyme A thioesterase 9
VARKRDGSGGHTVPPLTPETETEKRLFADAAKIQAARKEQRQAAKDPSKQAESAAARDAQIEALLKPGRIARDFPGQADEGFVLMHETSLKNAITTQPQVRNTAGRVFGGALMRYALELAFATAYAFSGCRSGVLHWRIRPGALDPRRCDAASMAFRAGALRRRALSPKSTSCGPWRSARCSP